MVSPQTVAGARCRRLSRGRIWRGVFVQQQVAKLAETAIEFPPVQKGASFNLEADMVTARGKAGINFGALPTGAYEYTA